jgi:asparagine synthase (glutamine-hydrolysing)
MCGIAGMWGGYDEDRVAAMLSLLSHRGPDAEGLHRHAGHGLLGHRRLSIMDPTGGDQPLYNESREVALVANGEVYNFAGLRGELAGGHQFQTGNDSEAIIHLYEECGPEAVDRLDGMFAFALASGDELFLARDPLGIKPLYFALGEDHGRGRPVWFASELKSLTSLGEMEVHEFPPGCWFHSREGLRSYYALACPVPDRRSAADHAARLRELVDAAVCKRLMSDVPLGAFLSGGLDSSILCAVARQHVDELHTFSVGLEGSPDILAARRVADHLGTIHHEHLYTPQEVLEELPHILYHLESFDQDLVRSAIPCHFCSRLAAQHVKVVLTGEGADELFAGYTYYRDLGPGEALHRELHRSILALHNVNLQRVDRLTMAHGLEGRVPFLDRAVVEYALAIPPEHKLQRDSDGRWCEKWLLREAFRDLLPAEIVWRDKQQFDQGTGTADLLDRLLADQAARLEAAGYRHEHARDRLRSGEEAFYHELLCNAYAGSRVVLDNVARWAERDLTHHSAGADLERSLVGVST